MGEIGLRCLAIGAVPLINPDSHATDEDLEQDSLDVSWMVKF